MPCPDENAILDVLGGRLPQGAVREHDQHFAECEDCRALLFEARAGSGESDLPAEGPVASSVWLAALGLEQTGQVLARAPALEPGATIARRYELERPIGEGGMGVVWAAHDRTDERRVALKFLKAVGKERAARMIREARIAASLRHPAIVDVFDVVDAQGLGGLGSSPVIVMELLDGESLAKTLRSRGPLPANDIARILSPVVDALGTVHAAGVVHRDLKPENIFLTRAGAKVLDFGLAKRTRLDDRAEPSISSLTHTGAMIGTPHYMAPEQVFGEKTVDARADVWALGVILHECLSGKRPIGGDNFGQVIKNITVGTIPPLDPELGVPEEVGELARAMMSRAAEDRPSLDEVSEVLSRAARGASKRPSAPPQGTTADRELPFAPTVEMDSGSLPGRAESLRPRRGSSKLVLAFGAAAVIGVGGLAAWVFSGRADPAHADAEPASNEAVPPAAASQVADDLRPASQPAPSAPLPASSAPAPLVSAQPMRKASPPASGSAPAAPSAKLPGGVERFSPY
jgi:eukaryotic-like serine/threonine-protein kinase